MSFSELADETIQQIFKDVPRCDLKTNLAVVSKQFNRNVTELLWKVYTPSLECIRVGPRRLSTLQVTRDLCLDTRRPDAHEHYGTQDHEIWYGVREIFHQLKAGALRQFRWKSRSNKDDSVVFAYRALLSRLQPQIEGLHIECDMLDDNSFDLSPFLELKEFSLEGLTAGDGMNLVNVVLKNNGAHLRRLKLGGEMRTWFGRISDEIHREATFLNGESITSHRLPQLKNLILMMFDFRTGGSSNTKFGNLKSLSLQHCRNPHLFLQPLTNCGALNGLKKLKLEDSWDTTGSIELVKLLACLPPMPKLKRLIVTTCSEEETTLAMRQLERRSLKYLEISSWYKHGIAAELGEFRHPRRMGFSAISADTAYPSDQFLGVQTENYRLITDVKECGGLSRTRWLREWPEAFSITGKLKNMEHLVPEFYVVDVATTFIHLRKSSGKCLEWGGNPTTPVFTWDVPGLKDVAPKLLPSPIPANADVKVTSSSYPQLAADAVENHAALMWASFRGRDENDARFRTFAMMLFRDVPSLKYLMYGDTVVRRSNGGSYRMVLTRRWTADGMKLLVAGRNQEYVDFMDRYGGLVGACCNWDESLG